MDKKKAAAAFNKWLDDYTNNPEAFEHMTATVLQHAREKADGAEPSYGEACTVILEKYMAG